MGSKGITCACLDFQPGIHAVREQDGVTVCMAHTILGLPLAVPIRHLNGDTLDNRCVNLEAVEREQHGIHDAHEIDA